MPKYLTDIQLWNADRTELYPPLTVSWNQESGTSNVEVTELQGGVQAVWDQESGDSAVTVTQLEREKDSFSIIDDCSVKITRRLGGIDELRLTVTAGSKLAFATKKNEYLLSQGKIIRQKFDDGSIEEWRIKSKSREFSGSKNMQVVCEPIKQDLKTYTVRKTLGNGHTRASVAFYDQTLEDIASNILSTEFNCPELFTLGSVDPELNNTTYDLVLNASYIMDGLKELCGLAQAEWKVTYNTANDNYELHFAKQIGGGESEAEDRPIVMGGGEGNRLKLEKKDGHEDYFSRIVALMGQGSEIQTVGGAIWDVDFFADGEIALTDHAIAKDGYGLIDGKTIYFGNETEGWVEVAATTAPNKLTVVGDASAITQGFFKEGAAKNDVIFLEDPDALSEVGVKEEKFSRPDIVPYANLVDDAGISAAMSDWAGGLPSGMQKINGAEAVDQEINDLFVKHGQYSAKVSCDTDQGLETVDINLRPQELSPEFSTTVYVQVENGAVRIEMVDSEGDIHPTDKTAETHANETRAIKIGGAEPAAGPAKIRIIAQTDNTVFYLDAITLTQSAHAVGYAPLMGPKDLWMEAGKHLKRYGGDRPDVWTGEVMDSAFFSENTKEIEVGSFVSVKEDWNEHLNTYESQFTVRVVEVSYIEDRINGRYKKTVRLADKNHEAARLFQEQYVTVGSQQASLGVKDAPSKGLYDRAEQKAINDQFDTLNQNLGNLDNEIAQLDEALYGPDGNGGLNNQINTLDGYIQDPSTIPDGYSFFEGIVTNEIWAQNVVAMEGWFENLVASDFWADKVTANSAFFEAVTAAELWSDQIVSNTILSKNANITGTLTVGGKLQWDGGLINASGIALNGYATGDVQSLLAGAVLDFGNNMVAYSLNHNQLITQPNNVWEDFILKDTGKGVEFLRYRHQTNSNGNAVDITYLDLDADVVRSRNNFVIPVGTDKYAS